MADSLHSKRSRCAVEAISHALIRITHESEALATACVEPWLAAVIPRYRGSVAAVEPQSSCNVGAIIVSKPHLIKQNKWTQSTLNRKLTDRVSSHARIAYACSNGALDGGMGTGGVAVVACRAKEEVLRMRDRRAAKKALFWHEVDVICRQTCRLTARH